MPVFHRTSQAQLRRAHSVGDKVSTSYSRTVANSKSSLLLATFFFLSLSSLRAGLSVPDPDWKYERTQARKSDPSSHFSLCTLGTVR